MESHPNKDTQTYTDIEKSSHKYSTEREKNNHSCFQSPVTSSLFKTFQKYYYWFEENNVERTKNRINVHREKFSNYPEGIDSGDSLISMLSTFPDIYIFSHCH